MYLNSGEFYVLQHFFVVGKCHRAVTFGCVVGGLTPRSTGAPRNTTKAG